MRLLIAEDDPKLLKSLVHIFQSNHYVADGVDNGALAFDYASSGEYDGLVLDIMMPGMNGVTLLTLNRSTYEIGYNGATQSLSGKEFQVMEMLMQQPGMIITAEQLITHIWGWNADVDTSVVWVHISNIRKKLDHLSAPVVIRFVRNAGYLLEAIS